MIVFHFILLILFDFFLVCSFIISGGMPTFIDASDNFDPSQDIKEDNLIWQLNQNGIFQREKREIEKKIMII
jgi:hypothetical protein